MRDGDSPAEYRRSPSDPLRQLEDPTLYLRVLRRGGEAPPVARPVERSAFPVLGSPASVTRSGPNVPYPRDVRDYLRHSCDITMPAGNGLGLLYPTAACALAQHYVLRRVAGASSGAIAAAATAAAELGRTASGEGDVPAGFAGLARAVRELGEGDRQILRMMRPRAGLHGQFRLVIAALEARRSGPLRRAARIVVAAHSLHGRTGSLVVAGTWLGVLLGWAALTVVLNTAAGAGALPALAASVASGMLLVVAVAIAVVGVLVAAVASAARLMRTGDAGFGLVDGGDEALAEGAQPGLLPAIADRLSGVPARGGAPAWSVWVADLLDDLAGIPAGGDERRTLTFGDLWQGSLRERDAAARAVLRRARLNRDVRTIDLEMAATDLSLGRAIGLPPPPADAAERAGAVRLVFCDRCLDRVLPRRVVVHLVKAAPSTDSDRTCPRHGDVLRGLPDPEDFPVALAVRMSAAVPGLITPVPLYSAAGHAVRTHWVADGGLTANAPVATFDALLPRWPTFSAALDREAADAASTRPRVDLPDQVAATPPGGRAPVADLRSPADAIRALARAALGWRDAADAAAPSTAGRIARVGRPPRQGLFPGADEVRALARAGLEAGTALRERFTRSDDDVPGQTRTDRYRWIRLRDALRTYRWASSDIAARMPLYRDLASSYHVPESLSAWFDPPLPPAERDPLWAEAVTAVATLRALSAGGALDIDVERGAPPRPA